MDTLRILIADDESGMRLGVRRGLRNFSVDIPDVENTVHFMIDEAESGEEALEKITADPPHILLLDYKMPGISGLDVLDKLRNLNCGTLTIMITAYASIETAVTATKRGAYDFLAKPFTPDELKAVIKKAATRVVLAEQAKTSATEKRAARFELIRMLGHELQTPLNVVEGYLHLIKEGLADSASEDIETYIDRGVIRLEGMRRMIADLLDMTRIDASRKSRNLQPISLCKSVKDVIDSFESETRRGGITLEMHCEKPITFTADGEEITVLLNNLISNAIKYNRDGGRVDITLAEIDQGVKLTVADSGIGIDRDEMERLFGEFSRIKNEKTRHILGSGLGLSIVKKLASLYDGDVKVDSVVDVGTTFTVTLKQQTV